MNLNLYTGDQNLKQNMSNQKQLTNYLTERHERVNGNKNKQKHLSITVLNVYTLRTTFQIN